MNVTVTDPVFDLPRGCTFDAADWAILARCWYPVAVARDVGDQPVGGVLLDAPLVIYRADGVLVVADDLCPHRGVPLSMGVGDGRTIACAYHGFRFGAEGRCVRVPAHPDNAIPGKLHLRTYPAIERYGLVWTCLRPEGEAVLPPMPHWDDPAYQQITCPWIDIGGFAGRQVEGFIDVAHFAFVHTATFADPGNAVVPSYVPRRTADGFEAEYRSSVANYPVGIVGNAPPGFEWLRHFRVHLPFTATLEIHFPDDGRLVIMNAAAPVSARKTRMFAPICRNFDTGGPVEPVYEFNRRVFEEDRALVEAQKPENLPLDPTLEAHVMADRSSIAYRRGLKDMGLSRFFTA
ncbi:vanillate O-demethylase oxygenase [Ameyamaea chiangmaiensis NBRC 103196]|uniref:Aromatic ring-hydroxylating dioxygenase subunit alpha n=1 Tax=Ameyamaea chiangmaiensis TaxID=442969 RepID=A0A850P528_9PROT|nr:aromatic ring-hydroxylating dioxygenase subunit alpha [Ameyamaea chiangmaiensis]MBS4075977.1 aromatic ring-hydroxylating dioxygenase subunit alpha [Ameyamaea chiangmaiensis]NVN39737.1 aromatic ring-hydroxylating dioxygenase subunit alpha [Ameyamaea chiangmaiensis]GBQ61560.1 vanillate O-demethylase oxygenase [Ameyamaea chiangmaiensis NBRC 103196]